MRHAAPPLAVIAGRRVATAQQQKQLGATLFELAVALTVITILASVLLHRVRFYQAQAEHAAVVRFVAELRTILHMKVGQLRSQNKQADIAALVDQNPMEWLAEKPPNYRGEWYSPKMQDVEVGNWYFDRGSHLLVYLIRDKKTFEKAESNRLSFKVELSRLPTIPAKPSGTPAAQYGVVLNQVNG
ncbi:MAG: hypothetical protein V4754_02815 [Pseudomonadota bacterium]